MNCEQALIALSAELDGELSPEARAALDDHLAHCPACRALREDLAALHAAWDGMDVEAPDALMENVLGHLPPQEPVKKAPVIRIHWRRWAGVAAGLVLVVAAAWALSHTAPAPTVDDTMKVAAYGGSLTADVTEHAATDEVSPSDVAPRMMTKTTGTETPDAAVPETATPDADVPEYVEDDVVSANAAPSPDPSSEKYVAQGTSSSEGNVQPPSDDGGNTAPPEETVTGGSGDVAGSGVSPSAAVPRMMMLPTTGAEAPEVEVPDTDTPGASAAPSSPPPSPSQECAPENGPDSQQGTQPPTGDDGNFAPSTEVMVTGAASVPYLGTLTLSAIPDGDPVLDFPCTLQEDGASRYELPAQDFQDFIARLDEAQVEYELETSDPSAELGLVIVTGP